MALTNFLDAEEEDYVKGEISAEVKAAAEVSLGLYAKLELTTVVKALVEQVLEEAPEAEFSGPSICFFKAEAQLTEFWESKMGSQKAWNKIESETVISESELAAIRENFYTLGVAG